MNEPLLECVQQDPETQPLASVIWMHGLGADGNDFSPVPPYLGLPDDLPVRYVFPHAPKISVTFNQGLVMPAWYDVRSLDPQGQDEYGIQQSARRIRSLIEREVGLGIAPNRIVLAGFSQGAAMALFTGLRYPETLAGIMALSGYLVVADKMVAESDESNRDTPIFQAHGLHDPMLPVAMGRQSRDILMQAGYRVEWHEYAMAHEVCMEQFKDIGGWLTRLLSPSA